MTDRPAAWRLSSGTIVTQDASQRWCDHTGYPLPLAPNLDNAVELYYSETP